MDGDGRRTHALDARVRSSGVPPPAPHLTAESPDCEAPATGLPGRGGVCTHTYLARAPTARPSQSTLELRGSHVPPHEARRPLERSPSPSRGWGRVAEWSPGAGAFWPSLWSGERSRRLRPRPRLPASPLGKLRPQEPQSLCRGRVVRALDTPHDRLSDLCLRLTHRSFQNLPRLLGHDGKESQLSSSPLSV